MVDDKWLGYNKNACPYLLNFLHIPYGCGYQNLLRYKYYKSLYFGTYCMKTNATIIERLIYLP